MNTSIIEKVDDRIITIVSNKVSTTSISVDNNGILIKSDKDIVLN